MQLERTRVDIAHCAKTYADGTRGLQPTDLTVEPGEVLALLGPSGCGKTTLLRLVAGLEAPDAGSRITFGSTEVTHIPIEQRGVGMVFQHYALFPQMSVEANIGYGLRIRGVAEDDQERTREDGKASSVQFLRFPFTPAQVEAFRSGGGDVIVGFDHPGYGHMAVMPPSVRQALARDFA